MTELELYNELSEQTGESIATIRKHGFLILEPNQIEERDEPLVIDWDEFESQ